MRFGPSQPPPAPEPVQWQWQRDSDSWLLCKMVAGHGGPAWGLRVRQTRWAPQLCYFRLHKLEQVIYVLEAVVSSSIKWRYFPRRVAVRIKWDNANINTSPLLTSHSRWKHQSTEKLNVKLNVSATRFPAVPLDLCSVLRPSSDKILSWLFSLLFQSILDPLPPKVGP